ncbi:MAG: universal stress protein [Actinomycetes bacterium]
MDIAQTAAAVAGTAHDGRARPRVVVGIDGSPGSREALVQALLAAARRGADLEAVSSYSVQLLYYLSGGPVDVPDVATIRASQQERARAVVDEVKAEVPVSGVPGIRDVAINLFVCDSPPAQALLDRSEGAALLVVGSRGRGAVRSVLLGSVALHCVTHASCPVLVVHPSVSVGSPPRILVGVDGSEGSRAALAAAIDEAARTSAEVEALATYEEADYWTDLSGIVQLSQEQVVEGLTERTRALVGDVLAERGSSEGASSVSVRIEVVRGSAAEMLIHRGASADLLVVGSRGRGAFRGLLLGSVALHCAMHAPCPVLVVHPKRTRSDTGAARMAPAVTPH